MRGRQGARAAALESRAAVACDVPPAARGNACSAAVVGRLTEREALCHDLFGVCASEEARVAACVRFRCGLVHSYMYF